MRRPLEVAATLFVAGWLAACGDPVPGGDQGGPDEGPALPPPCEVIYDTGEQVHSVVEVEETTGCLIGDERSGVRHEAPDPAPELVDGAVERPG